MSKDKWNANIGDTSVKVIRHRDGTLEYYKFAPRVPGEFEYPHLYVRDGAIDHVHVDRYKDGRTIFHDFSSGAVLGTFVAHPGGTMVNVSGAVNVWALPLVSGVTVSHSLLSGSANVWANTSGLACVFVRYPART